MFEFVRNERWGGPVLDCSMSAFHSAGWLKTLQSTYMYSSVEALGSSAVEAAGVGVVLCSVESRLTGRRLVSLPFADHCEPLVKGPEGVAALVEWIQKEQKRGNWKYIELRPINSERFAGTVLVPSSSYWLHTLSLEPSAEALFSNLNKDNLQRRIRRAERESLVYARGSSPELLDSFYRLLLKTRRRQALLPQPRKWFENLLKYMSPDAEIRLASKGTIPVAAIFTLRHKGTVVYKYGCSDEGYHNLGAMPFLFWKMIEESKNDGAEQIDFGRTDLDHAGLIAFKNHFGATRRQLTYLRYPPEAAAASNIPTGLGFARRLFRVLPDFAAAGLGRIAYRHFG
jgi:hypothetical protein